MMMSSFCVTCTRFIYTLTYDQIDVKFDCSHIVVTLSLSLFMVSLEVSSLMLAFLSEFYR